MKKEVKIGIFAVLMIGCAWAGVRFLSGFDIFSRNNEYYAAYDQINGVQSASPIMIKGVKVGTVTGITFDPALDNKVVLRLTVKRQYHIPVDSEAKIFSSSIMGSKAIEIKLGNAPEYLHSGDTLRSGHDRDLMDVAGSELDFFKQKVSQLTADLSRTLGNVNVLLEANTQSFTGTMDHINGITGNLDELLAVEQNDLKLAIDNLSRFSETLGNNAGRIDSIVNNIGTMTSQLTEKQFAENLSSAIQELNIVLAKVNQGEGTIGSLVNDNALYASLASASANLSSLLANLQAHPGRYVHFSLFGRNEAKMQERAEKRAEKRVAKARRDSLCRVE